MNSIAVLSVALHILLWAISLPIIVMLVTFSVELAAGLAPLGTLPNGEVPTRSQNSIILIPAHNEAAGIGATLEAIFARIRGSGMRVLVVADNCCDATASIARELGAIVVERHDQTRIGKGYALAFGQEYLRQCPPDIVIILDADCQARSGSLLSLAAAATHFQRPVQACNLIEIDQFAKPMTRISTFAFLVKNLFRQRGLQRLGGGVMLTGTGMAFPWAQFESAQLASDNIVEDLALGIEMARAGLPPQFVEEAEFYSAAAPMDAALGQRERWERGFMSTAFNLAPRLIGHGLMHMSRAEIIFGLHLMVPPLALLIGMAAGLFVCISVFGLLTGIYYLPLFIAALITIAGILILIGWAIRGRNILPLPMLIGIPLYIIWKIPLYLGLFRNERPGWIRTARKNDES